MRLLYCWDNNCILLSHGPSYLSRYTAKFLCQLASVLNSQQIWLVIILAIGASILNWKSGTLTLEALKQNAWTPAFPYICAICLFAAVCAIRAAINLEQERAAEWRATQPKIILTDGFAASIHTSPSRFLGFLAATTTLVMLALLCFLSFRQTNPRAQNSCETETVQGSHIVSRAYAVAAHISERRKTLKISFQVLFYEWFFKIRTERQLPGVTVILSNLSRDDRLSVIPETTAVSEAKPKWATGFEEPYFLPDYYFRTAAFTDLQPGNDYSVAVMRPLKQTLQIDQRNLVEVHLAFIGCSPKPDSPQAASIYPHLADVLSEQARKLAKAYPVRVESAPPKGGFVAVFEFECGNRNCDGLQRRPLDYLQIDIEKAKQ